MTRKHAEPSKLSGDIFGNTTGGYSYNSRGNEHKSFHKTYRPDISTEGSLLRPEPTSNKPTEEENTHRPFTNIPPSVGGIQLFEFSIDAETNTEERRQLNMADITHKGLLKHDPRMTLKQETNKRKRAAPVSMPVSMSGAGRYA